MRNNYLKMLLLVGLLIGTSMVWGVITDYSFAESMVTYTELAPGTIHGTSLNDNEVFNAIPIGFTFTYNSVEYTTLSIASNGFIAMGDVVVTSNFAISSATASNNAISALNRDIKSRDTGVLSSHLTGTAPNRVFTIQWHNYRRIATSTANDTLNFQIKLHETSNVITFNYGYFMAVTYSLAQTFQVGLRGASNAEYFNRTTTTNWAATTAGTINTATCVLSSTVYPANGLKYTWTPPTIGDPPLPPIYLSPANGATNVALTAALNWVPDGPVPSGYKVYFGTDNPPTNIVNGTIQTLTSFNPDPDLIYNTVYYWKIISFNDYGDALNCPVWSFTSMPNPTVYSFPYTQNWDSVTAPVVPPSWTIVNANNDAVTWTTVNTGAYSAPNALRISFGTVVMDDWAISPPLVLVADSTYRIQFRYKAQNASFPEKLEIKYGNANNPAALTEQIYLNESLANTGYLPGEAFISPTVSGTYFFGFHGFSSPNMYYLFIDDVTISKVIPVFNPPRNLAATTGNGVVSLSWLSPLPPDRALRGYNIFRNGSLLNDELIMANLYIDNTAIIGTSYTYYAVAVYVSPNGTSDPSNSVNITPGVNPPRNLAAVGGTNIVNLSWQAPVDFSPVGYKVYRDGDVITPSAITSLIYSDNAVTVGVAHNYYVTAIYTNPESESLPSNTVMGEPWNPPLELTATASDPNVILNWLSPVGHRGVRISADFTRDLIGFKVYRDTTLIHTINDSGTETYTDMNLIPGTYNYRVTAMYTTGESVPAGPVQATVSAAFLPPSNLVATGSISNILLTWDAPSPLLPNLVGYRLFKDGLSVTHSLISTTTYTDTQIISGVVYSYYVVAVYSNPTGTSVPSNTATASGGEPLNPVTNLQCSVAFDSAALTWTPPGGIIIQDWIHYDSGYNTNAIGNNAVLNFDVAIRFTQTELSGITDRYVIKAKFFPREANCVYALKIWTGGSTPTNPGTLLVTVPVPTPTIGAWNEVVLPAPIQIPSTGDLWIGVNMNTQTGYPAGCDAGPSMPYKSNLIYVDNAWTILTELNPALDYNWNIQAFITNFIGRETVLTPMPEMQQVTILQPVTNPHFTAVRSARTEKSFVSKDDYRPLTGYKVYRDGINIATINEATTSTYTDSGLPNGSYSYTVTALYNGGESAPCTPVVAVINVPYIPTVIESSFETYSNFSLSFYPWMVLDGDNSATYGITDVNFTNEESPMAFMVFNPGATTPPMTSLTAHTGQKLLTSFAATTPPNNDWVMSPKIRLGVDNKITFWAKSFTDAYGPERFRVGISTAANPLPATFVWISGPAYVEAPTQWTQYSYNVPPAYNTQVVRYGIKCESDDAFIFCLDDIKIQGTSAVANEDEILPLVETSLLGNYPNPFNPETSISYQLKTEEQVTLEVYNLKGQKVKTLVNEKAKAGSYKITWKGDDENGKPVSSGVYFYRMTSGKYSSSRKMILMK